MKIEIDTSKFVNSHGRDPKGRGNWWFEIFNRQYFYSDAPYGQAIKAARNEMKRQCLKLDISSPPAILLLP